MRATSDAVEASRADHGRGRRLQPRDDRRAGGPAPGGRLPGAAGVCGVIGAPAFGTEVSLDVNTILTGGRSCAESSRATASPTCFLPRLIELWRQGRFPVDRLMTFYDFDRIEQAAHDAEAGTVDQVRAADELERRRR